MLLKCLVENTSSNPEILSEHGLSLYIETLNHKILFDCGQTDLILKNAEKMGVNLKDVDLMILSHGHYDHGGGLKAFLSVNSKAHIFMSKYATGDYYNGKEKYIGLDKNILNNKRIVFTNDEYKICKGLTLYSCNDKKPLCPVNSYGLNKLCNGIFLPDDFLHEQYLLIEENAKKILISGCSHKGILNIENWFSPDILIGGFHLVKLDPECKEDSEILLKTAEELLLKKTMYYTCHCTGVKQYEYLKKYMKNSIQYLKAGQEINL